MPAYNCLYIIAFGLAVVGMGTFAYGEGDGASGSSSSQPALAPDGTPVVHKSLHKKKKSTSSASASVSAPKLTNPTSSASPSSTAVMTAPKTPDTTLTVTSKSSQATSTASLGPSVETGLPVARHSDLNGLAGLASPPLSDSVPAGLQNSGTGRTSSAYTSFSSPGSATISSYSATSRTTVPPSDFVFTNTSRRSKNTYPWKTNIITTMFYIGEGGSSISSTTNLASSWDQEWVSSNHGTDSPYNRNGFASGSHASTVNPFYVALPFNDLVFPDKARRWLPDGWHRPNKDGKPVSACKDRWVEIKLEDGSGHVCYAQWEDVGPLRYDHAEYVFGPERPDTYTRAGLDVSPAVAQYLGINGDHKAYTRWRFVDDEDVPPGQWLKLDEQAVIYEALHHPGASSSPSLPIQRASEPIDDPMDLDTNKKKVGAAKG